MHEMQMQLKCIYALNTVTHLNKLDGLDHKMVKAMRCSPKPVCDGRQVFGAESMSQKVGKRVACMKRRIKKTSDLECFAICPFTGKMNTRMIVNVSQSSSLLSETNTPINPSGRPDETQIIANDAQLQGAQNSVNLSNDLQT